jgi:hypothetical protein
VLFSHQKFPKTKQEIRSRVARHPAAIHGKTERYRKRVKRKRRERERKRERERVSTEDIYVQRD